MIIIRYAIFILLFFLCQVTFGQGTTLNSSSEMNTKHLVEQYFAKGKVPPFSFVYNGKKSDSFITRWQYSFEKKISQEPNVNEYIYTYSDKQTGLSVKCLVTFFDDFPAVEWVLKFSNQSGKNTPVIEKVSVIDHAFVPDGEGDFMLHHSRGSDAERIDFRPFDTKLSDGESIYLSPSGGRSSDGDAFPFFNIAMPGGQGIVVAVGWTGKWYADVQMKNKSVLLKSGMENLQTYLYPNEEIRTPKICLLFWKGEESIVGHNHFRQFILEHHSRKIDGKFAEYPLSGSFDYGDPPPCNEYVCLTEEYAVALVKRYQLFKIVPEVFWLDAGWYTGCGWDKENGRWSQNVGNFSVDKERFPNGLKPIADAVHSTGAKFMVWFEPERVVDGTELHREHPEWLIRVPGRKTSLLNLGNEDARLWLTDHISGFLQREGIDYYRQDFNIDPASTWQSHDKPGRMGMTEIKHIEGLYAFWDSLLVRFPKLLIDNCASGGRRLDLETISRSAPLWRTDYQYGEVNGYQCHTYALNLYLPIHGTAIYKTDPYFFRSGIGSAAVLNWEITGKDSESIPDIQKRIREFKELRPYFYGDFYPLTGNWNYYRDNAWLAYQLNRPQQKDGIIVAFRRSENPDESIQIKLSGLDRDAVYELHYEDYGIKSKLKGVELMNGFDITIPVRPSSLLIRYKIDQ